MVLTSGFTLIELVMTIAIAAVLLSVAVPSFQSVIRTNRAASLTNELSTALQLARSEAVSRGKTVTVCKSNHMADVSPTCNAAASWQDGWIVFVDDDRNGSRDASGGTTETMLRVGQPSSDTAVITGDANFANYVSYLSDGRSDGINSQDGGSLIICVAEQQRTIEIAPTGRLRIIPGTCP